VNQKYIAQLQSDNLVNINL